VFNSVIDDPKPFSDGLRGALIIYDPEDPLSYLYDVDDGAVTTIIAMKFLT